MPTLHNNSLFYSNFKNISKYNNKLMMLDNNDAKSKMRLDPNLLQTVVFMNPEPLNEISPTLPELFPEELIPSEICEKDMLNLIECLVRLDFDNVKCEEVQFEYYQCKRWRDSLLFKRIKEWEVSYLLNNTGILPGYVNNLKTQRIQLINEYENVPNISKNTGKRIRYNSDIQQLDWRLNYIKETTSNYMV